MPQEDNTPIRECLQWKNNALALMNIFVEKVFIKVFVEYFRILPWAKNQMELLFKIWDQLWNEPLICFRVFLDVLGS